eukprot:PhM_4_TR10384/c1_g1_i1/m.31089/K04886/KCNB2; potassium voltage-gated channel Shab-related subfamily B member 2
MAGIRVAAMHRCLDERNAQHDNDDDDAYMTLADDHEHGRSSRRRNQRRRSSTDPTANPLGVPGSRRSSGSHVDGQEAERLSDAGGGNDNNNNNNNNKRRSSSDFFSESLMGVDEVDNENDNGDDVDVDGGVVTTNSNNDNPLHMRRDSENVVDEIDSWDDVVADEFRVWTMREKLHGLVEGGIPIHKHPNWHLCSTIIFTVTISFILTSIVTFTIETLPRYYESDGNDTFRAIEYTTTAYFTLEVLLRYATTARKQDFFRNSMTWIDIAAILPTYVELALGGNSQVSVLVMIRVVRLIRLARVMKLSKHSIGMQAVAETLIRSTDALALLVMIFMIAVVFFSSLIYYAEQSETVFDYELRRWVQPDGVLSPFQSIPHSFWWCTVSITTVGYGDHVPYTPWGKAVAGATVFAGIFVVAFPTIILGANFQEIYNRKVHERNAQAIVQAARDLKVKQKAKKDAIAGASAKGADAQGLGPLSASGNLLPADGRDGDDEKDRLVGLSSTSFRSNRQSAAMILTLPSSQEWLQPRGNIKETGWYFYFGRTTFDARPIYHTPGSTNAQSLNGSFISTPMSHPLLSTGGQSHHTYWYDPIMEFRCVPNSPMTLDIKLDEADVGSPDECIICTLFVMLDNEEARETAAEVIRSHLKAKVSRRRLSSPPPSTVSSAAPAAPVSPQTARGELTAVVACGSMDDSELDVDAELADVDVSARPITRLTVCLSIVESSPLLGTTLVTKNFHGPVGQIPLQLALPPGIPAALIPLHMKDVSFTFLMSFGGNTTLSVPMASYNTGGMRRTMSLMKSTT